MSNVSDLSHCLDQGHPTS